MENSASVRVVTLKELWEIFVRRWWVMFLTAVICAGGVFEVKELIFVPDRKSVV